ncbi:MAG: hypothetical protein WC795_01285 [Candidatus Paceibacterota bacterium]|jgi:hypothetical protein
MSYTPITADEVASGIKGIPSPDFRIWVWHAFEQDQLDLLIEGIIKSARANTKVEALEYLATCFSIYEKDHKVSWGDISRTSNSNKLFRALNELITGEGTASSHHDRTRYYGVIGHVAIPELFFGNLINLDSPRRVKKEKNAFSKQFNLFPKANDEQDLFSGIKTFPENKKRYTGSRAKALIEMITDQWCELKDGMHGEILPLHTPLFFKFRNNLKKIFGDHLLKVINHSVLEDERLAFLTLMTWASALDCYKLVHKLSGNLNFFREVPMLPYEYDLGAGRLDVLELSGINGKAPTEEQSRIIRKMTTERFASVGHIMDELLGTFGGHLSFLIRDWKFAVGDGPKGMRRKGKQNIMDVEELRDRPLKEHDAQARRYISMAVLSHALASKAPIEDIEKIWETKSFSIKGQLVYLLPEKFIIHDVVLTPEEIKLAFEKQIVANFKSARRRSFIRHTGNALANHAIKLMTNTDTPITLQKSDHGLQTKLEEILTSVETISVPKSTFATIISQFQTEKFKDEHKIIEIVDLDNGKEVCEMHLDRLFGAIKDGRVQASREFNGARGGFVSCFVHNNEDSPSLSVSFSKGMFKCFSCGVAGRFVQSSIPDDVRLLIKPARVQSNEIEKLIIPTRHQEIMLHTQELLQQAFKGSKGERYLRNERGLDPDMSFSIGAGFADERFIHGLLERKFSYEELLNHGLLGISSKISERSGLVTLLKQHGYSLSDLMRPIPKRVNGKIVEEMGLPYSILENRLTYPLELGGIIDSFYGRSVDPRCPKGLLHRKLLKGIHNIPHGAFNMAKAMSEGNTDILVTEAPIDADTFLQKSDIKAATAIIGVNNKILFELLAGFSGNIIIAFDYDKEKVSPDGRQVGLTGQRNTITLTESLRERGFKGEIYDFTAGFLKKNPGVDYKDANGYWKKYHKQIPVYDSILQSV